MIYFGESVIRGKTRVKHIRLNLFKLIKENESVLDERVVKERRSVESLMFLIFKLLFSILLLVSLFDFFDEQVLYKILYYSFYVIIWTQPLVYSSFGLWEKASDAKLLISTGCMFSLLGTLHILEIAFPKDIINKPMVIAIGIFVVIVTYFIYAIPYYNYIRKQDIE